MRLLFGTHKRLAADVLIAVGVLAALALVALALYIWMSWISGVQSGEFVLGRFISAVGLLQPLVTALVLVVGGIFAYRKLQLFRDFEPHLTVTQSVSSRAVGKQYAHVAVTATLHNSSKVRVEVRECLFRIHQIQPLNDEDVEHRYVEAFREDGSAHIEWPILDDVVRSLESNEVVIEPGARHHETCEFILSRDVETVLVYSYFYNTEYSEVGQSAQGWTATTIHDMLLPAAIPVIDGRGNAIQQTEISTDSSH